MASSINLKSGTSTFTLVFTDSTNKVLDTKDIVSAVSPAFSGVPTAPTALKDSATKQIANTEYVQQNAGLILINPVEVLNSSATGALTSTVSSSTFGGKTPSLVYYSAKAYGGSGADLRGWDVSAGSVRNWTTFVIGMSGDDTDQGAVSYYSAATTFVLPYSASQQFFVYRSGGAAISLKIDAIGYQL